MLGQTVLGYKIEEELGSGGFGTVYKASKTDASGTYIRAVKHITIPTQKQYADVLNSMGGDYSKADDYFASVLNEIVNEIQIISRLSEKGAANIVRYYDHEIRETESPKRYDIYILMECLTPFPDYMAKHELKVSDVVKLGKDILNALISCHSQNIIHRDIKDDNIFIDEDGNFRLGDFGVSKMLKDRTRAESVKGTPNFIAPEVYLGKEAYDKTVDIYSLGVVLYRLLNKSRNPFVPDFPNPYNSEDEDMAFEKRMKGEVPELPFDAKNALGEAIVKAIQNRQDRYNSAQEFLNAIEEAASSLSSEELGIAINQVIPDFGNQKHEVHQNNIEDDGKTVGIFPEAFQYGTNQSENSNNDADKTVGIDYSATPVHSDSSVQMNKNDANNAIDTGYSTTDQYRDELYQHNVTENQNKPYSNQSSGGSSNKKLIAIILPIIFIAAYILIYLVILPISYGKVVNIFKWLFNNPSNILSVLQNGNAVFIPVYQVIGFKILMWVIFAGFIGSLFYLGWVLQNEKPAQNMNGILKGKEAYLKATEIYEEIKNINSPDVKEAKTSVRNVTERLRNESDCGYGNDSAISCENDIAYALQDISDKMKDLYDEQRRQDSAKAVTQDCQIIMSKLKVRTQLLRK